MGSLFLNEAAFHGNNTANYRFFVTGLLLGDYPVHADTICRVPTSTI